MLAMSFGVVPPSIPHSAMLNTPSCWPTNRLFSSEAIVPGQWLPFTPQSSTPAAAMMLPWMTTPVVWVGPM